MDKLGPPHRVHSRDGRDRQKFADLKRIFVPLDTLKPHALDKPGLIAQCQKEHKAVGSARPAGLLPEHFADHRDGRVCRKVLAETGDRNNGAAVEISAGKIEEEFVDPANADRFEGSRALRPYSLDVL